jgi:hypothetical protein
MQEAGRLNSGAQGRSDAGGEEEEEEDWRRPMAGEGSGSIIT